MNEQELNKKLAEWAGFVSSHSSPFGAIPIDKEPTWYDPNDNWIANRQLPAFTSSLDACFKWLVPKLNTFYSTFEISFDTAENPNRYIITIAHHFCGQVYRANSKDNPALALCLAIEKLVDSEAKQ